MFLGSFFSLLPILLSNSFMPFSFFLSQCWTIWYKMFYSSTFLTFIFPSFSFQCFYDCVISFAHLIILNRFPLTVYFSIHFIITTIIFTLCRYFTPLTRVNT